MQQLLRLIYAGTYVVLAVTLFCLWRIKVASGDRLNFRLLAKLSGGMALILVGTSVILPNVASPQITSVGVVTDFHQVSEYRSSHFEFRINGREPEVRAYYFDKGFYFGDPSVSNGDIVDLAYLSWTNHINRIREIAGHHPGWTFQEDLRPLGPWLLIFGGVLLLYGAVWGKLTDVLARSDTDLEPPAQFSETS